MSERQKLIKQVFGGILDNFEKSKHFEYGQRQGELFVKQFDILLNPKEFIGFSCYAYSFLPKEEIKVTCLSTIALFVIDDVLDLPDYTVSKKLELIECLLSIKDAKQYYDGTEKTTGFVCKSFSEELETCMGSKTVLLNNLSQEKKYSSKSQQYFSKLYGDLMTSQDLSEPWIHVLSLIKCQKLREFTNNCFKEYVTNIKNRLIECGVSFFNEEQLKDPELIYKFRVIDAGSYLAHGLIFLDKENFEPYRSFLESDNGMKVQEYAARVHVIINDIVSLHKDIKNGFKANYVMAYLKTYNTKTEKDLIEVAKSYFKKLEGLKNTFDDIGNEVVDKILLFCKGHIIWAVQSKRYQ